MTGWPGPSFRKSGATVPTPALEGSLIALFADGLVETADRDVGVGLVGGRARRAVEAQDEVVKLREQLVGRIVDLSECENSGREAPHGGRGSDAVSDDIAHAVCDRGAGQGRRSAQRPPLQARDLA